MLFLNLIIEVLFEVTNSEYTRCRTSDDSELGPKEDILLCIYLHLIIHIYVCRYMYTGKGALRGQNHWTLLDLEL